MNRLFETTIELAASELPREYLGEDCPLYPTDLIEVDVVVEYYPGSYQPASLYGPPEDCYPEMSEPPEIQAVRTSNGSFKLSLDTSTLDEIQERLNVHDEETRWEERLGV